MIRSFRIVRQQTVNSRIRVRCHAGEQHQLRLSPPCTSITTPHSCTNDAQYQQVRTALSSAITRRFERMVERHDQLMQDMQQDSDRFRGGKELASLSHAAVLEERRVSIEEETASLRDLLEEAQQAKDEELLQECRVELDALAEQNEALDQRILQAVLPKDEDDMTSDTIVEIRAGTGGDEACLFAAELMDAYQKSASAKKYDVEIMSENRTELGGIKDAVISITSKGGGGGGGSYGFAGDDENSIDGDDDHISTVGPYGYFKFESGVHRVQRVPVNDSKIHTSACSVAALPLQKQTGSQGSNELLPMSELRIDTMRSSGAGGQSVNTTDSAVRVTHIPTGIVAAIQDERSQHRNKDKALKLVAARVRDQQRIEKERELGANKSALMGGGDRSERIRTYNFPQDRVTDHRCKHSSHGIVKLFEGGTEDGLVVTFYPHLRAMHKEELMQQLEEEEEEEEVDGAKKK